MNEITPERMMDEEVLSLLGQLYQIALKLEADDRTYGLADSIKNDVVVQMDDTFQFSEEEENFQLALWYAASRGIRQQDFQQLLDEYNAK
jgi:hypothetical protein